MTQALGQLVGALALLATALAACLWAFRPHVPKAIDAVQRWADARRLERAKDEIIADVHAKLMTQLGAEMNDHKECRKEVAELRKLRTEDQQRLVDLDRKLTAFVELVDRKDKIIDALRREKAELQAMVDQLTGASGLRPPEPGARADDTNRFGLPKREDA